MDADDVLTGLLVVSLVLAILLMSVSLLLLGRKLLDLEYQKEEGINGTRQRQSWTNIRTNGNRVFLGAVFVVVNALLLYDAPIEVRMWVNRTLWVVLLASGVRAGILDWRADGANLRDWATRRRGRQEQAVVVAFDAGVKQAEGVAEEKADALAHVAVVSPSHEVAPVAVESIAPDAAQAIAQAVQQQPPEGHP